ncbi:MAG TPA: DNA replication initiation control protein YabA [Bacillota bacterium]|nr:DNA replication initiation control protein YabA [Bacillota bacterium]
MNKREIFDQVSDMEKRIGELYEQLGDLKGKLGSILEENHRLSVENHHLRNRLDPVEEPGLEEREGEQSSEVPSEGYDNLARLYEEGFHICNVHFGSPREKDDCLFCLLFLNKTK